MPLNYIRLLAGLRGGFQKGIAGWRLRLTQPTKTTNQSLRARPLPLAHHRQKPLHRPRAFKAPPAERDIGVKLRRAQRVVGDIRRRNGRHGFRHQRKPAARGNHAQGG